MSESKIVNELGKGEPVRVMGTPDTEMDEDELRAALRYCAKEKKAWEERAMETPEPTRCRR